MNAGYLFQLFTLGEIVSIGLLVVVLCQQRRIIRLAKLLLGRP